MRGAWNGKTLTDIKDVYVSDDVDMEMSRIAFGRDGMLYMTIGGPGTGPAASLDRPQHGNDDAGKILRMTDDGKVPPDNPFVGKAGFKPYIYTMGHRTQLALALNPFTGEMWAGEQGPNGGDEVNILQAGPQLRLAVRAATGATIAVTTCRRCRTATAWSGRTCCGCRRLPSRAWRSTPAIGFPNWQRNLFVGGMREGEIARTGQLQRIVFNDKWDELRRESLLRDLHQRIRDVRQGPDGLLYVLTDEDAAALLKIEPVTDEPATLSPRRVLSETCAASAVAALARPDQMPDNTEGYVHLLAS